MQHEHDVPDYASDPEGKVIALDSHIRLANPRTAESESSLMLRRGYSYSLGVTNSGQLDMGLLFCLLPTRSGKRLPDSTKKAQWRSAGGIR
ncbi:putative peroxidase [Escherichia coli]|uniref:Putative peroxidase n=1 Tax=Escherichia coli TaxID=562 RepID=A0A376L6M7_ECOLX|nr:putative peroxidase [Escherichia coli]